MSTTSEISGPPCAVVMYHYVREKNEYPFPGISALSVANFTAQLDWLNHHYRIIDYPTFAQALLHKQSFPEPTALLTFDDGLTDHYETVFPILRDRGLSGVFFACDGVFSGNLELLNVHKIHLLLSTIGDDKFLAVVRGKLEKLSQNVMVDTRKREGLYPKDLQTIAALKTFLNYQLPYDIADIVLDAVFREHVGDPDAVAKKFYLSKDQVQEMSRTGMTFGTHTLHHRVLSRLTPEEQKAEVSGGIAAARSLLSQPDIPFCYPYGGEHTFDAATKAALTASGYQIAFAVRRSFAYVTVCDPLDIPRHDTIAFPPIAAEGPIT